MSAISSLPETEPAQEFISPSFPKQSSSASDDLVAAMPR
jgi:hypothetical protein